MDSAARPRREVAVGLIVDSAGRLLLQHRDNKPGLPGADLWGFFGGHIESDERPSQTFLREMEEELGWRPRHLELYGRYEVDRGGFDLVSHAFAAHLDVPQEQLVLGEGQAFALFAPDALPEHMVPGADAVLREFAGSLAYRRVKRSWAIMTTTALIVDGDGNFLLQHRDDKPEIDNPGMWGSFGGELEPYETPDEGLLRELDEELAWQPASFELDATYPYDGRHGRQLIYVYAAALDVPLDRLVLGEGQGLGAFPPDSLPERTVPELRMLIERFAQGERYRSLAR